MNVNCPVSLGELLDKISILSIKNRKISDTLKLEHVNKERNILVSLLQKLELDGIDDLLKKIEIVNEKLWEIEDEIRLKESQKEFDQEFVRLARAVYVTNDERFHIKNEINQTYGSSLFEVKSYEDYL